MKRLLAVAKYEFLMQVRRSALWISTLIVILLEVWDLFPNAYNFHRLNNLPNHFYIAGKVAEQGGELLLLITMFLVADRILRDKKLKTTEVIMATPISHVSYVLGKYLGNLLAVAIMPALLLSVVALVQVLYNPSPFLIKPYLTAFAIISIPAVLFVTGLSIAIPAILGSVRIYYALFVAYFLYCFTVVHEGYAIPFYELIADAPKLIFYSQSMIERLPYTSAYINILFLCLTGNLAVLFLISLGPKNFRKLIMSGS